MNSSPTPAPPLSRARIIALLLGIFIGLPTWTMIYMFLVRPALFEFIMSVMEVQSIRVPIMLHVLLILGTPFVLAIGISKFLNWGK